MSKGAQNETLLRTSERGAWKKCPWLWDRVYNDHLKPKDSAPALRFGTLVHKSLEAFYLPGLKRGPKPEITFAKLYKKEIKSEADRWGWKPHKLEEDETWVEAVDLGVDMMKAYYALYGKDTRYKVVATEAPFQVPVYHKGKYLFTYVGQLDGIWFDREKKKLMLVDHKTCASIDSLVRALPFLSQSSAYWTWGVDWIYEHGLLKPDQKLNGLMFNMLRKAMQDTRPRNAEGHYLNQPKREVLEAYMERHHIKPPAKGTGSGVNGRIVTEDLIKKIGPKKAARLGEVSEKQPPPYFHRENSWRDEADRASAREHVRQEWTVMEAIRTGKLLAWKLQDQMGCNGCGFRDPCELDEAGQDWRDMMPAYEKWSPYDAHETYYAETRN